MKRDAKIKTDRQKAPRALIEIQLGYEREAALRDSLGRVFRDLSFMVDRDADEMMQLGADAFRNVLSREEIEVLKCFGQGKLGPILAIRGLPPLTLIPPTPYRGFGDDRLIQFVDAQLLGVFALVGVFPIAFTFENDGRVFRNVVPAEKGAHGSHGYGEPLQFHTDNPCAPFETKSIAQSPIPHFLGFIGLRNSDKEGKPIPTEVLPFRDIVDRISNETAEVLRAREFTIRPPESNNRPPLRASALVVDAENTNESFIRYNAEQGQIQPETERGRNALSELNKALNQSEDRVVPIEVESGVVLIFDNFRTLHRRRKFDPGNNLRESRWLRRSYACVDADCGAFVDKIHWPVLRI